MKTPDMTLTDVDYRCVIARTNFSRVLAIREANELRLPIVTIPPNTRPALALQQAIRVKFGLDIFVLEAWAGDKSSYAAVELLTQRCLSSFTEIALDELSNSELSEEEPDHVQTCEGYGRAEHARVRGNASSLQGVLGILSKTYRRQKGMEIAVKREWNAWLVEDAGNPLSDPLRLVDLLAAARHLASLQVLTVSEPENLLAAAAWDQRLPVLKTHIGRIVTYLIEAMARQTSTKAVPLSRNRLTSGA